MPERIYPATRERWRDLERLFGPRGAYWGCWCMFWRLRRKDFASLSAGERKSGLRKWVRSGAEPGLLAYRNGEPVAWCALAPRSEYAALGASRKFKPVGRLDGVWSITCFFVAKEHRRTGLMSALLDAAARHARRKGGRVLEGYPVEAGTLTGCDGYTGLVSTFRRAGFCIVARPSGGKRVMQRAIASPGSG